MISEQQIEQLRAKLDQERQEIESRLEDDSAIKRDSSDTGDEVDRANQEESQQLLLNRRQHDLSHLRSVRDALRRIEEEDFGFCESCGEDISEARLVARPESRYCIDCQDLRERKQRA